MELSKKRNLLTMTYFALIAFMVTFAIIFSLFLGNLTVGWAQVIYYIWLVAIVLTTLYDVICTYRRHNKYTPGILLFIITLLTFAVSIILFFSFAENGVILATNLFPYISSVYLSYAVNIFAIIIFCVGEKIITYDHQAK